MSSTRSCQEVKDFLREQREGKPDFVPPSSHSSLVVSNSAPKTNREYQEFREAQQPEQLTPPPRRAAATTGTLINAATMTTRERRERADALARVNAESQPQGSSSQRALIDYYADQYLEECAERERKELERQQAQAKRIAQEQAQQKAHFERAVWLIGVNQMFDTLRATDEERARVLALPSVTVGMDADKVGGILLTLRSCTSAAPDWVKWAKK